MERTALISPAEIEQQLDICRAVAEIIAQAPGERPPLAFVDTYGCPNVRV